MATIGAAAVTIADYMKVIGPDGNIPPIIEIQDRINPILQDIPYKEGNLPLGEQYTVRTGLPSVFWRIANQGSPSSKSKEAQITESCGLLDAWSEIDKIVAEINGNTSAFRMAKAVPFLQSMNKEKAETLFYGNQGVAPAEFTGWSPRYADLSANNSRNIIDVGGTDSADNLSIWLIVWGDYSAYGFYPKGSQYGLKHEDLGEVTVDTTAGIGGSRMRAYQDHFYWHCGLAVPDWRQHVRICNIDVSKLVAQDSNTPDLIKYMIMATHRVENLDLGKPMFYMNRTCAQYLDLKRRVDVRDGGGLTWDNVEGKIVYSFRGIQIRVCDGLLDTEAIVV